MLNIIIITQEKPDFLNVFEINSIASKILTHICEDGAADWIKLKALFKWKALTDSIMQKVKQLNYLQVKKRELLDTKEQLEKNRGTRQVSKQFYQEEIEQLERMKKFIVEEKIDKKIKAYQKSIDREIKMEAGIALEIKGINKTLMLINFRFIPKVKMDFLEELNEAIDYYRTDLDL